MKISKEFINLVIILDAECYGDQKRIVSRCGYIKQISEISKYFNKVWLYAPPLSKNVCGIEVPKVNIEFIPLVEEIHKSIFRFPFKLFEYRKRIKEIINQSNKNTIFMTYVPGTLIGIVAAYSLKKSNRKYFLRVTADLAQEFKLRGNSKLRKFLSIFVNPILNIIMIYLVKDSLSFYSGDVIYKTTGKHYAVTSASFNEDIIYKRENTCKKEPYNILYVGRFDAKKGVDFLISALREPINKGYKIKLTVVGFGEMEQKLKSLVKELNLEKYVEFKGYIPFGDKLFTEYKKADIFVLPSLEDKHPKTPLEAMAFGVPVIATNTGTVPKYVINEKTGLLIKPTSSQEISESIIRLINDNSLRKKLIKNAYKIARNSTLKKQIEFMIEKIKDYFKIDLVKK